MAEGHLARAGGGVVAGPGSVSVLGSIDGGIWVSWVHSVG